jgi:dephospho-CoA kinase
MPLTTLGIIGPIASGKSTVARMFGELGAVVVNADELGHEVLREPEVEKSAREKWGGDIFAEDGHIDRARLAQIVFAQTPEGEKERLFLEQLTHPGIRRRLGETLRSLENDGVIVVVLDAALLLEAGWDEFCAKIIYVEAPGGVGLERAKERGWSTQQYAAREAAQMPLERKRERADIVLDNSGTSESLRAEVQRVWSSLRA